MAATFKKMVYFDPEQERQIKQLARAAQTSDTEIVRRAVAMYWKSETARVKADARRIAEHVRAHPEGWPDEPAQWFHG